MVWADAAKSRTTCLRRKFKHISPFSQYLSLGREIKSTFFFFFHHRRRRFEEPNVPFLGSPKEHLSIHRWRRRRNQCGKFWGQLELKRPRDDKGKEIEKGDKNPGERRMLLRWGFLEKEEEEEEGLFSDHVRGTEPKRLLQYRRGRRRRRPSFYRTSAFLGDSAIIIRP